MNSVILFSRIKNIWLRYNVHYFLIGLVIGTFLNIIFSLNADNRTWRNFLMTYVVSVIITLCITNISILISKITDCNFKSPVINILFNYLIMAVGVIIGTAASNLVASFIYNVSFSSLNYAGMLQFNLILGFIAGTIIYLYQLQADNYNLKIREKEVQLLKLSELKTQADLKTLQARINPHFLYNALNSITSLIHDDPERAEAMILKLSQLFRYSINPNNANWSTVKEEAEIADVYLDIERIRFGNRITIVTSIDPTVSEEMIPRFLLQPLIENSLKHGLKDITAGGLLKLEVKDIENSIEINVYDNGIPFPREMFAGYGLQSTVDKLNLLYGNNWKMQYINDPEKRINIELPKKR